MFSKRAGLKVALGEAGRDGLGIKEGEGGGVLFGLGLELGIALD